MPLPLKPFYMIRHGESVANRDGYFSGNLDVELTERGRHQANLARQTVENLNVKPVAIIHSHLNRAIDTAKIINEKLNLPLYETSLLGEHQFGDWERQPWEDVRPRFHAGANPPNGETHEAFGNRIKKGFLFALEKDGPALIVCHGGVFRGFNYLYGKTIHGIENCKLYSFTPNNENDAFPWDITLIE